MQITVRIQRENFDPGLEQKHLQGLNTGAIVTFTGAVRELSENESLIAMELEHYPGMTEKTIKRIILQAGERWPLQKVTVIHRVGKLLAGDNIVFTGVASQHRQAAFTASEFIMDHLKTEATFWKKEITESGSQWLMTKASDIEAKGRWYL